MEILIDFTAADDCMNPNSYGEICVKCNGCGRFDKATQKESALRVYRKLLQEQYDFDRWHKKHEEQQRENIAADIKYFEAKIAELEKQEN